MKVLYASPMGRAGGIARCADHIVDYYTQIQNTTSCEVDFLSMSLSHKKGVLYKNTWSRLKKGIVDYYIIAQKEKDILRKKKYDIIHIASSASISLLKDLYMTNIAHKRGVKVIIHFHFGRIPELFRQNNWEWKLLLKVVRRADKVIVIDELSYKTLLHAGFTNIHLLPNPVTPKVCEIASQHKHQLRDKGLILFVGHGCRSKGIYELVEACRTIPQIRLKLIGSILDSTKEELYKYVDNAKWLEIVGELPYNDVISEMCRCDIFVLPTYTEGFPNVILESMACACPIITTTVGAIPEMLDINGSTSCGVCIEPRNVEELRLAIENLLKDENKKLELGLRAQKRVMEKYSINSVWEQMLNIWKSSL